MHNIEKVRAAVDFIEANLTRKLSLDRVAEAVHYSAPYLHRAFTQTVGMTPHDYWTRRQLTEAAKLLVFSRKSIMEVALLSGYESQQSFHGAFKSMYKLSPKRYRDNERFYPLQLRYVLEGSFAMLENKTEGAWDIARAVSGDIPCWMALVRLVIDGFPHLNEEEHIQALLRYIGRGEALIIKDGPTAVGILLFSRETGSIDFMGTHPLYRKKGIPKAFLDRAMGELLNARQISITTYREGDKADTGHREQLRALGFAEAELLEELGYPTQRFVLPMEAPHA